MLKFTTSPSANKAPAVSFLASKFTSFTGCKTAGPNSANPWKSAGSSLRWRSAVPVPCIPRQHENPETRAPASSTVGDYIADIASGKPGLRLRWAAEYDSWRGMKDRRRFGYVVAPDLMAFANFLRIVGPCPGPSFTLDRIDPFDIEYAPGKVRWADKITQTRNRRGTHVFRHPEVAKDFYAPEVAKMVGVKENTVRKWRREGWSDHEIFLGRRLPPDAINCTPAAPKDTRGQEARELAETFVMEAEAANPNFVGEAVTNRRTGQAKAYMRTRGDTARPVMMFAVANWIAFTKRAEIEAGAYNSPLNPSLDYFFRYEHVAVAMWREAYQSSATAPTPTAYPKAVTHPVDHDDEYEEWFNRNV